MSQFVRLNISMSLLSFMVLFRSSSLSSSNKSKSSSCSSSPNNNYTYNSPASQYSATSSIPSSSSSSSNIETNKPNKSWPRRIRSKFKKLFDKNMTTKHYKKSKKSSSSNNNTEYSCEVQPISSLVSLTPSSTRNKCSVRFSPICVIIDENSRPCGHAPLKLEPREVVDPQAYDGPVNLEFRKDFMKMKRDFFHYLDELEEKEGRVLLVEEECFDDVEL